VNTRGDSRSEDQAAAAVAAIRSGDVGALRELLSADPGLAAARVRTPEACDASRTLLHVATDWPGHFPNTVETVRALIAAGADVDARFSGGPHTETPLHWAASSDDVEVLDVLIDSGADVEAEGAVIGGGTPLADAVAFGQWNAARRLVERGARPGLWQAAALGLMPELERHFAGDPPPSADEVTNAFWCACHGGQRDTAAYLLARGAERDWVGHDGLTPLDAAARSGAAELVAWLRGQRARSATELSR
jgi:ankyrin repeat protein